MVAKNKHGVRLKGSGRKRLEGDEKRVQKTFTLSPLSISIIEEQAEQKGESASQIVDGFIQAGRFGRTAKRGQ